MSYSFHISFRSLKYTILAVPFLLAACGDGYEMIRTDTMFPYGNQRTAGSGVAYVLAKMMPEKELKLEPAAPAPAASVVQETTTTTVTTDGSDKAEEPAGPPAKAGPMDKVFHDSIDK